MSSAFRLMPAFVFWLCAVLGSVPAAADEAAPAAGLEYTAAHKLHRGAVNAATGIAEAPKNIDRTWKEAGWFEALTFGAARGAGLAIARTASGFYEMATFYLPAPKNHEPLMRPEYIDPSLNPSQT
jgi:putative exosortase-associated protein (TIGR04073 family)